MEIRNINGIIETKEPILKKEEKKDKDSQNVNSDVFTKKDNFKIQVKKDNNLREKNVKLKIKNNKAPKPKTTIFKTEQEKGEAEKFLDRFSGNAFDPVRSVEDKFLNLKPINTQGLQGNITMLPPPNKSIGSINLEDLKNVSNFNDLVQATKKSLGKDEEYIKDNLNAIAQKLGDTILYEGFTSFIGDANGFKALNQGYGVCTDIHASVTAFRKAFGQEAYLVLTTGSDSAHVFTIFKENGTWNIQNYGNVYNTNAKTIAELYDIAMPEQRKIKIYDVDANGNVTQLTTDHLTATGLAERRFKAESGVGTYNPWITQNGVAIGSNEISLSKDGFYMGINPMDNSVKTAYYKKTEEGDTKKIIGGAIEGADYTNPTGYMNKHIDAKFEWEKKWDNGDKQIYGREHFSAFAGIEKTSSPFYWQDLKDGATPVANDPAFRFGVSYERNDSKLFGSGPLKFELGHQTKLGTTITSSTKDPISYDYVGRIYGDTVAESKLVTGVFYQPTKNLTVRGGLASGVDLPKIDGVKDVSKQIKNISESDAYVDVNYGKGPVAVKAMGFVPLHNPTQYKVGGGVAFVPMDKLAIGATYIHEKIVNDKIDSIRVGAEFKPRKDITLGAGVTTPVVGDNAKNIQIGGFLKIDF